MYIYRYTTSASTKGRALLVLALVVYMVWEHQTLPLMGAFYVIDQIFGKFFC